ncbi:helix-turn-helix domain-containing protein [Miniphocaeibacter massiliensis]|uniref:helix-turn-helix domain-containing protein n=1 Tax=Miniphocaeibacter massiliensis TaxID=2041841 RepID=UPI000C1C7391|nr:helix-turn-helix transcriptional regulator [Miniphocaeibacter massiliensis]
MCKKTVRQLRREKDITQEQLAELTGLTTRTITLYENDTNKLKKAKYENIEKIAKALDVSINDIFLPSTSKK